MRALDLLAALRLDDGRTWAEAATDVQLRDAQAWLEGSEPYHYCVRSRGYSKTQDAAGALLAVLATAEDPVRCYALASDRDQARLVLDSVEGFARRTPALSGLLDVHRSLVRVERSGAELVVLAADAPGTWGLRPNWIVLDEIAQWAETESSRRLLDAALTAAPKENARVVVITTPGSPRGMGWQLREHARTSDLWRLSETPGPAPWIDPERLDEQRARLPPAVFRQLYGAEWLEASGDFLDASMLEAAFRLPGPTVHRDRRFTYQAALDLGHVNDRSVLAIVHREGNETRLDRMLVWRGRPGAPVSFDQVGRTVRDVHREYGFRLIADPWQALEMVERLRKSGIRVDEFHFSAQSKMRLASSLLHALNTGSLGVYPAEGLREELLGLRLVQRGPGLFAFDHAPGEHDDMAVALSMALVGAVEGQPKRWGPVFSGDQAPKLAKRGLVLDANGMVRRMTADERAVLERQQAEAAAAHVPHRDPRGW
jgi:hypothetical protein